MRIWSLHPKYLDSKGLVACWRETLLALKVLEGNTRGYKNHSQLIRFKESADLHPTVHINNYLHHLYEESKARGYNFDKTKFNFLESEHRIKVTKGQLEFELEHLVKKVKIRDPEWYKKTLESVRLQDLTANPLFTIVDGETEIWERI